MSLKKQNKKQTEEPTKQKINIILLKKKEKRNKKKQTNTKNKTKQKFKKKPLIIEKIKFDQLQLSLIVQANNSSGDVIK